MEFINLLELDQLAEKVLEKSVYAYFSSGANGEVTLNGFRGAYDEICLDYRVLVDVSERNLETTVLGHKLKMPLIIAPTALHKLVCPEGELATARAMSKAGIMMILSSLATTDVEDVVQASQAPVFFQMYIYKDRSLTEALVRRAERAGCQALVLTVDQPVVGCRERVMRDPFELPKHIKAKNALPRDRELNRKNLAEGHTALNDPSVTWKDVSWLQSITKLPLILKGIIRPDDALRARDCGVSAIVVSNHGGRQLDTSTLSIHALPRIVDALQGSLEILIDGGIRRGTDVIKALAYGARAVMIGRPIIWGLALGGEEGASAVLNTFRKEIDLAMALTGSPTIRAITRDLIHTKS